MEPLHITLKPDAPVERVKMSLPHVATEEMDYLGDQMQQLWATGMVRFSRHAIWPSVAMAVPKR